MVPINSAMRITINVVRRDAQALVQTAQGVRSIGTAAAKSNAQLRTIGATQQQIAAANLRWIAAQRKAEAAAARKRLAEIKAAARANAQLERSMQRVRKEAERARRAQIAAERTANTRMKSAIRLQESQDLAIARAMKAELDAAARSKAAFERGVKAELAAMARATEQKRRTFERGVQQQTRALERENQRQIQSTLRKVALMERAEAKYFAEQARRRTTGYVGPYTDLRTGMVMTGVPRNAISKDLGIRNLNSAFAQLYPNLGKTETRLSRAIGGLRTFGAQMLRSSDRMTNWGKNLQWTGRQLEYRFTMPLLLAGAAATYFYLENERSMTRLEKVYDGPIEDIAKLERGIRALSEIYGVNKAEVAAMAAEWAAAGAVGGDLLRFTQESLEGMAIGDMNATDAAHAAMVVSQAWRLNADELALAFAQLNAIENATAVSFADLITVMQDAGGVAASAGVDVRHLAAMAAALVPASADASEAGNMLKTTIARIMAPTKQADEAITAMRESLNITAQEWENLTFVERIEAIAESFDKLDKAQQQRYARDIAQLRQISRFIILTEDLTNENSRYAKALEVTADNQEVLRLKTSEVQKLLQSDPKKFERALVRIQNILADLAIMLMPSIMMVMDVVTRVLMAFNDLDPTLKGVIVTGLALIAVLGPLAAWLGAIAQLLGTLGRVLLWSSKMMWRFLFTTQAVNSAGEAIQKRGLITWIAYHLKRVAVAAASWAKVVAITALGWARIVAIHVARWAWMIIKTVAYYTLLATIAIAKWAAITAINAAGSLAATLAALGPIGWLVIAAAAILTVLVVLFHDEIWQIVKFVAAGMKMLPEIFAKALSAVARVVKRAIEVIRDWLSYLNPFQRHSPSLVDNVTRGVDVIIAKYKKLEGIAGTLKRTAAHLNDLNKAAMPLKFAQQDKDMSEARGAILAANPSAGPTIDAAIESVRELRNYLLPLTDAIVEQERVVAAWLDELDKIDEVLEPAERELDRLKDIASAASEELSEARDRLNELARTPIAGSGAFDDAIFDNEMAIKALRLEILKLEEAGQSVDDLSDRFAALGGEIEALRAAEKDLRAAGAGSEVLKPFQDRIEMLEAQRREITETVSPIEDLEKQLKDLERQAQILDLERALAFDPLERQIDKIVNGMQEMPFDELIEQIKAQKKEVDRLESAWKAADKAVKDQQKTVDDLRKQRKEIEESYEREKKVLDDLIKLYDEIERMISAITSSLSDAKSAAGDDGLAGALGGALGGDWDTTMGSLDQVMADLDEVLAGLEELNAFDFELPSIKQILSDILGWVVNFGAGIIKWLWGFLDDIATFALRFFLIGYDWIKGLIEGAATKAIELAAWFANLPFRVIEWVGDTTTTLFSKGIDLITGLLRGLEMGATLLGTWFFALPFRVLGWFLNSPLGAPVKWLVNVGKDLIQGLIDGVRAMKNLFKRAVEEVLDVKIKKGPFELGSDGFKVGGVNVTRPVEMGRDAAGWIYDKVSGKASGGPVAAYGQYLVGESGPEILQLGSVGGRIIPNDRLGSALSASSIQGSVVTATGTRTIYITGDLSFPNITSGDDAEEFIRNLEALAGR